MHEGTVSAELGFAGYPSVAESAMVERDLSLAGYEDRPLHLMHLSARESVEALEAAQARGVQATAEVTPHHLVLTDEAVRSLDPNVKMNPPLRSDEDRQALLDGAPQRRHRRRRDRPRAALAGGEGSAVRGGAVRRHRASRPRSRRSTPTSSSRGCCRWRRCSSGCRPARRARSGCRSRESRSAPGRTSSCSTSKPSGRSRRPASAPAPRTRGCSASTLHGAVAEDRRRRPGGARMSAFLALEDGTIFHGESVGAEGVAFGEAVFTTAMTGYQETVTDPSFAEQLVCFTAPMVGNYGVAAGRAESPGAHAKAVLMREARGPEWTDWLAERGIVALTGHRHALARAAPARGRRDARGGRRRRDGRGAGSRRRRRAAVDGGRRARRPRLHAGAVRLLATRGRSGSRSSTTAASARSCGGWPAPART